MIRITSILLLAVITCFGDYPRELIRFSSEREAWLERDIDTAIKEILPKVQGAEADVVALYNIGYLYYLKGKDSQALPYLQRAIKKDASYPHTYLIIAKIYEKSGNNLGALTQIRRGLEYDSDNYDLSMEIGRIHILLGNIDQAQQVFTNVIKNFEDKVEPRIALSQIFRRQNKLQDAKKILEENDSLYPESALLIEKANVYRAMGDLARGAKFLLNLCQDYPFSPAIQSYQDTLAQLYDINEVAPPDPIPPYKYNIRPDESLDYKVKYGFITLGWMRIRMEQAARVGGKTAYPIIFFVDSNPSFDFLISLHHIYESYIDEKTMNAIRTRLYTQDDEVYLARVYYFEYEESKFLAQIIYADGRFGRVSKPLPRMAQDGTSMLYFARGIVSNNMGGTTTVVIDEEYKYGHITFLNEVEEIGIKGEDTEATKIFAKAEFKGIAGMNGDAWGWFSRDNQYVPLQGKIKIILGSITVQIDDAEQ